MAEVPIADIIIPERRSSRLRKITELAASIAEVGLLHPVVIRPDKTLVAGARRITACKFLGWATVPVTVVDGLEEALQALKAETAENICREDLTPVEAVEQARLLDEMEREKARERMVLAHTSSGNFPELVQGDSRDAIGAAVGMSGKTYEKAKAVVDAADAEPEAFKDLVTKMQETGKVDSAYKEVKARKQKVKNAKIAEEVRALPQDDRWHVEIGDIRTYQTDQRFDFIITDPPYPREYLGLYGVLAERAKEWLKPGGLLLAMCGQSCLDEIMRLLSEHLAYYWTGCYWTPGQPTPLRQRQVNTSWKPVPVYGLVDRSYTGKIFGDVWKSDANDKSHHKWGQSESGMFSLISQVCIPGQTIFDPFCGAGATGVAALRHNCLFHGIDIDREAVDTTIVRLKGALDDEAAERQP